MLRLPLITDKAALPAERHATFDAIAESRGRVGFPFSLLLHSPEAAGRVAHLGHYLRFESALANNERELAILTAAREADCAFEWAAHVRLGRAAGLRDEAIEAITHRAPLEALTPDEALIITYSRQLLGGHKIATETFDAARSRFGEQGVVDLTVLLGYYTMIACALNGFEAEPGEGAARLP